MFVISIIKIFNFSECFNNENNTRSLLNYQNKCINKKNLIYLDQY